MKTVLFVCPPGVSPVRIYRGEGVFERLSKIDPEIRIIYPTGREIWQDLLKADVVYFMRTNGAEDVAVAEKAKDMKVPIWYDMDDDYFNVPPSNPSFDGFRSPKIQQNIAWFLQNADFVTFSTQDLLQRYQNVEDLKPGIEPKSCVVPNALDDYILKVKPAEKMNDRKRILWRGGITHVGDILDYTEEIWKFLAEDKDFDFNFIGFQPFWIVQGWSWKRPEANFKDRVYYTPYQFNYFEYMDFLKRQCAALSFVPLSDNPFNHCKSNIAALESIYAGAVPIVPDWREWEIPGVISYGKDTSLSLALQVGAGLGDEARKKRLQDSCDWINENRVLSVVNKQRIKIMERLMEK